MNTTEKKITFNRLERQNSMPTSTEIKQANPDVVSVKGIEITDAEFVVTVNVAKAAAKAKKTTSKTEAAGTAKTTAKKTTAKKTTAKSRLTKTVTKKED